MARYLLPLFGAALVTATAASAQWRDPYGPYGPYPYPPAGAYPDDEPPYWQQRRQPRRQLPQPAIPQGPREEKYRAVGTEPGWTLEIDSRWMVFSGAYGEYPAAEQTPPVIHGFAGEIYRGRRIEVSIVHRPCSDGMSDRSYPDTVQLTVDGQRYRGCGAAAEPEIVATEEPRVEPPVAEPLEPEPELVQEPEEPKAVAEPPPLPAPPAPKVAETPRTKVIAETPRPKVVTPPAKADSLALADTKWRIVSIGGREVPRGDSYSIDFARDEVRAQFGCKRFKASYKQDGDQVTTGELLATKQACTGEAATLEPRGASILGAPMLVWSQDREKAELSGKAGAMELRRR